MRTFGIERERFITDTNGKIIPAINELLPAVHKIAREQELSEDRFTFELFAGQIEDRTPPCSNLIELESALLANDEVLLKAARETGLRFNHSEIVKEEQIAKLKVNPFNERHKKIWSSISWDRRLAASVVAAVHVHISVTDEEAVRILSACRKNMIDRLISAGDHSRGKRIMAYRAMAETDGVPPAFASFSELMEYITSQGGEKNVWDFVRYKPSTKTVEFRMFGATECRKEILGYVKTCSEI